MYYPDPEEIDGGIEWWVLSLMSLPRNLASLRKQFYFTLFYFTTVVFSFMNTAIYWFITRPHELENTGNGGNDGDDDDGNGYFKLLNTAAAAPPVSNTPCRDILLWPWADGLC